MPADTRITAPTAAGLPADAADGSLPFSFELYPPRTDAAATALHETIDVLAAAGPRFISVTYGAGGSGGGRSLELVRHIREATGVAPLAHLTCVGTTYASAAALIREFLDAGITSFLALRGDPPLGVTEDEHFLGDLESAAQLVQLIDRVQAERAPYTEAPVHGVPGAARVEPRARVDIAVAAFPNGHPRSRHRYEDIDALLAKQAAGATLAVTQLFFQADDYLDFVARARTAGVTIPILPGVMPIVSAQRLHRVLDLTGEALPGDLARALASAGTAQEQHAVGVAHAGTLVRDIVAGGAPGIHLYAFNSHTTVLEVLREAGVPTRSHELEIIA